MKCIVVDNFLERGVGMDYTDSMKKEITAQECGRMGGKKARSMMTAKEWSAQCSRAAKIGWKKRKNPRGPDGKFIVKTK